MFPRGLLVGVCIGMLAGLIYGLFLFQTNSEEQLVYVDGTSLSIVTEKINFKLGEEVVIKIINSGTDELTFPDTSYGLIIKQLDSIPIYIPTSTQEISKLESHEEIIFTWNQLKNNNNSVLEGIYKITVKANTIDDKIIEKIVPLKRSASTQEIANVVSFLGSSDASYITGQIITVDGGLGLLDGFSAALKLCD